MQSLSTLEMEVWIEIARVLESNAPKEGRATLGVCLPATTGWYRDAVFRPERTSSGDCRELYSKLWLIVRNAGCRGGIERPSRWIVAYSSSKGSSQVQIPRHASPDAQSCVRVSCLALTLSKVSTLPYERELKTTFMDDSKVSHVIIVIAPRIPTE